jgi:5-methylcytosine-specific restriction endonuclease McrA
MAGWNGRGSTTAWRKIRAQVLERDNHICQLRIPGVCTYRATHVHHLHGKEHGDHPSGLVASCAACNLHLGNVTSKDPEPAPRTRW